MTQLLTPQNNNHIMLPPDGLFDRIRDAIEVEKRTVAARKRYFLSLIPCIIIGSCALLAFRLLYTRIVQSGFLDFVMTALFDKKLAMTHWDDFTLSIIESIPIFVLIISIGCAFLFFFSLQWSIALRKQSQHL